MRVRVLIAGESAAVRRFLCDAIDADPSLEFAGAAARGEVVLAQIARCGPDAVLMGLAMAEHGGGALLAAIRRSHPALPVLVFSPLTELGASATLDALAQGATDWIVEPHANVERDAALRSVREELAEKISAVCPKAALRAQTGAAAIAFEPRSALPTPNHASPSHLDCIVIAAACGGPNALAQIFAAFREPLPVPIVVAQHMPPTFTRVLAERLNQRSNVRAVEAEHGMELEAGTAYVVPGGHRAIVRGRGPLREIVLEPAAADGPARPALDPLLESIGETFGAHVLAVALTGAWADGGLGCADLRGRGGILWAQDEPSSAVWGLGRAIVHAGLPERVLPLADLGAELERRVRGPIRTLSAPLPRERNERVDRFRTYRVV